jgi:hypothetical protein
MEWNGFVVDVEVGIMDFPQIIVSKDFKDRRVGDA